MTLPHDILYNSKITDDQKNQKVILYSKLNSKEIFLFDYYMNKVWFLTYYGRSAICFIQTKIASVWKKVDLYHGW